MKTLRGVQIVVVMLAAVVGPPVGRAQKPIASIQLDNVQQDAGQKAKTMFLQLDGGTSEGQQAQQKVLMEIAGAETQVVKGKAYSADTSTETVQTLADGNRITHRTVSKFYRDSEGRTRREQTFGNVDPEHPSPHEVKVFIDDPVNGTALVLDPGSKTLEKLQRAPLPGQVQRDNAFEAQVMLKLKRESEGNGQAGPAKVFFNTRHSSNPDDVMLVLSDENRDIVKEDLGARTIEGVNCTGTRETSTIAAGAIGNDQPIKIVSETWYSESIGAVVQSSSDDPRFGKTTYQLTNLQLGEPPRSLFELPSSFKLNLSK
jgi:hypothetical protein